MNEHLLNILATVVITLMGVINLLWMARFSRLEKVRDADNKRMNEIEKNYIDRFEELSTKVSETKHEILNAINTFNTAIFQTKEETREKFVLKEDCVHRQERHGR